MNVDRKAYELARHLLSDAEEAPSESQRQSLAEAIQRAVEDWFVDDSKGSINMASWRAGNALKEEP